MVRYYLALTNACNRSCDLCCMYSNPGKKTYMDFEFIQNLLVNTHDNYEIQLEGGEPLIHPDFDKIIDFLNKDEKCIKIIITTNGSLIHSPEDFINKFQKPLLLKVSVNDYLIKNDTKIFFRILDLEYFTNDLVELKLNVRLRKNETNDQYITNILNRYNLTKISDIYFYQRYGQAKDNDEYEKPFVIENPVDFYLYSPDGENFGQDLIARSIHMEKLN